MDDNCNGDRNYTYTYPCLSEDYRTYNIKKDSIYMDNKWNFWIDDTLEDLYYSVINIFSKKFLVHETPEHCDYRMRVPGDFYDIGML